LTGHSTTAVEVGRAEHQGGRAVSGTRQGKGQRRTVGEGLGRGNLLVALKRVERNGGAPGIDGMMVKELRSDLREHWLGIGEAPDQQNCAWLDVPLDADPQVRWCERGVVTRPPIPISMFSSICSANNSP
jgi:hypothetical protein